MKVLLMTTTKYLQLPFHFDKKKLVNDLNVALQKNWTSHFNTTGYEGEWHVIPLLAQNGDSTNILALPNNDAPVLPTPLMKECTYFQKILDAFEFTFLSVRLLRLGVGSVIKPHRDHKLGYEDGNFRLHIPITTNPNVDFMLDGDTLVMLSGECWYTNVNYIHSVANRGNSDRVHLVIDGLRNEWTDELFYSLAPKESFIHQPEVESKESIMRTIEELKRQNLPATNQLIATLKARLDSLS